MSQTRSRWGFLVAEAVLIVLSILLAFGIDAWWDERGTRQLRSRTLTGVRADSVPDNSELQRRIISLIDDELGR